MIKELDPVVLMQDLPGERLKAGDVGWVVLTHGNGEGFEIEFTTLAGSTLAVVTVPAAMVRPVNANEIPHARLVA